MTSVKSLVVRSLVVAVGAAGLFIAYSGGIQAAISSIIGVF